MVRASEPSFEIRSFDNGAGRFHQQANQFMAPGRHLDSLSVNADAERGTVKQSSDRDGFAGFVVASAMGTNPIHTAASIAVVTCAVRVDRQMVTKCAARSQRARLSN
ncbi:hypothetical protein ACFSAA_04410 [Sphingomonas qilianensis]